MINITHDNGNRYDFLIYVPPLTGVLRVEAISLPVAPTSCSFHPVYNIFRSASLTLIPHQHDLWYKIMEY